MNEYITDALVLDIEDSGDLDQLIYFYTPTLGKIRAKAKSIRKITSKLAGHLQPLSISKVRLVEKNGFQVVDAILIRQIEKSSEAIALLQFIKEMTFEGNQDKKLWLTLKKSFEDLKSRREAGTPTEASGLKKFSFKPLLNVLGFATDYATCNVCKNKKVDYFSTKEHLFLCAKCIGKIPKNEVVLISK